MHTRRHWREYWRLCRLFDRLLHTPAYPELQRDLIAVDRAMSVVGKALPQH